MRAYLLARLHDPSGPVAADVLEYLERVQSTLDPFGGRFLVHGGAVAVKEGSWPGGVVLVEFPSLRHAEEFYDSPAYRDIKPLRTAHIEGDLILVEGCGPGHDAANVAAALRAEVPAFQDDP
ncbi:MAG: DUF1330 domain-containing protein [Mycobacteriaceae bacterium]|nr:DUF1330 domain-containing protein [Mycobacteriaceae bacterium]